MNPKTRMSTGKNEVEADHDMNWFEASRMELKQHFSDQEMPEEEHKTMCLAAMDGFRGLFHELVKELKLEDEWPKAFYHIVPFATGTIKQMGGPDHQLAAE